MIRQGESANREGICWSKWSIEHIFNAAWEPYGFRAKVSIFGSVPDFLINWIAIVRKIHPINYSYNLDVPRRINKSTFKLCVTQTLTLLESIYDELNIVYRDFRQRSI